MTLYYAWLPTREPSHLSASSLITTVLKHIHDLLLIQVPESTECAHSIYLCTHICLPHFFYFQSLMVKKGKDSFQLGLSQSNRMLTRISQTSF